MTQTETYMLAIGAIALVMLALVLRTRSGPRITHIETRRDDPPPPPDPS